MNPQDTQPVNPQQQVIERLRTGVNVLVTVSSNPSVDQLAGAIGFTLLLNKLGKHATTVFSGAVPSTLEFLKPDETIEKNTDSLRDFIVSLDKNKADKLRYKVEQNVVKIFITPYHTSISEKDLVFSQGDFNVDVVLALGIAERKDLDQAITAHGRILHDATVITVSAGGKPSSLGAVNWYDQGAASLCEMLVGISEALQPNLLDTQAATAFLTGIVAETNRFSNAKTTPKIMSLASQLMAAGANQQLIATQLDRATEVPLKAAPVGTPLPANASPDGALTIEHSGPVKSFSLPEEKQDDPAPILPEPVTAAPTQIDIDEHGNMSPVQDEGLINKHRMIDPLPSQQPAHDPSPSNNSFSFTGSSSNPDEDVDTANAPLAARDQQTFSHTKADTLEPVKAEAETPPAVTYVPAPDIITPALPPIERPKPEEPLTPVAMPEPEKEVEALTLPPALDNNTLHELEKNLDSPHFVKDPTTTLHELEEFVDSSHLTNQTTGDLVMSPPVEGVDAARNAVDDAISAAPYDPVHPQPLQAVNAMPLSNSGPYGALPQAQTPSVPTTGMMLPPMPVTVPDPSGQTPPPLPPPMVPMQ